MFYKKVRLKVLQNSQESSCAQVLFSSNFNKNEAPAQVVSCGFCKISLMSKYKKANVCKCFLRKYIHVLCIFKGELNKFFCIL